MEFGSLPEKREIPSFVHKQSAEELAVKLIRQRSELEAKHKQELEDARKQADRLAEQLAMLVHKKRLSLTDSFNLSLRQLFKSEGISLITYVGEEVTETLENEADIVEWLPPEDEETAVVVDALEPEIIRQGRILHQAKLVCRQGKITPEQEAVINAAAEKAVEAPERSDADAPPEKAAPEEGLPAAAEPEANLTALPSAVQTPIPYRPVVKNKKRKDNTSNKKKKRRKAKR